MLTDKDDVEIAERELAKIGVLRKRRPRTEPASSKFMRVEEVLEIVPVCANTLYTMIKKGNFPKKIKFGHSVFWSRAEVEEWVDKKLNHKD